ncbi:hypothetical protein [Sphingomonas sp. HMP6]|uniref:hypothetical protein n=1 Tax=Sphingomonas sp. HMP6 TaxID=1517551 RepID=UPI001596A41C|nr:hypothetical protein [Sphingomonas sp. HMP6]BCA57685.1 hypothetical protein HMP06_0454 [Sphingomonas sp. HMP6]
MNREPIYAALFALVSGGPGLVTTSRKLLHWNDVPPSSRPALFMAQKREGASQRTGLPTVWNLHVDLYLYVSTQGDVAPGSALNPILDAIASALDTHPVRGPQSLGGLVQWARIEGSIETDEGTLGQDAVAIVPVSILCI